MLEHSVCKFHPENSSTMNQSLGFHTLYDLPEDVLQSCIFPLLPTKDLCSVCLVSRSLYKSASEEKFWKKDRKLIHKIEFVKKVPILFLLYLNQPPVFQGNFQTHFRLFFRYNFPINLNFPILPFFSGLNSVHPNFVSNVLMLFASLVLLLDFLVPAICFRIFFSDKSSGWNSKIIFGILSLAFILHFFSLKKFKNQALLLGIQFLLNIVIGYTIPKFDPTFFSNLFLGYFCGFFCCASFFLLFVYQSKILDEIFVQKKSSAESVIFLKGIFTVFTTSRFLPFLLGIFSRGILFIIFLGNSRKSFEEIITFCVFNLVNLLDFWWIKYVVHIIVCVPLVLISMSLNSSQKNITSDRTHREILYFRKTSNFFVREFFYGFLFTFSVLFICWYFVLLQVWDI